jgi:uncharacterized phage-like protein YoqJ
MTKVAITGHRADKLQTMNQQFIKTQLAHAFNDLNASLVIQGMCDGVDLLSAKIAYDNHIPYWAVRPWSGHTAPAGWRDYYLNARVYAEKVITLVEAETYPGHWVMHNRNKWMVDNSDLLVAVWNGEKSGGTFATIKYAKSKGKDVWRIDPRRMETGWLAAADLR